MGRLDANVGTGILGSLLIAALPETPRSLSFVIPRMILMGSSLKTIDGEKIMHPMINRLY